MSNLDYTYTKAENMITNRKLVICHDHWEFYKFGKFMFCGQQPMKNRAKPGPKENKLENRLLSFQRAKRNLRRLINTNAKTCYGSNGEPYTFKFLTLTFKENLQDIKRANYFFKKFIQRFSYYIYKEINKLKYATVIEFQKRGTIHYHLIIFNIPYIDGSTIGRIWSKDYKGNIYVQKIDTIQDVGSYVCKYMSKKFDDPRLCGEKAYFTSRNLEKPIIILHLETVSTVKEILSEKNKVYEKEFENEFCGKSTYTLYNLKDDQNTKNQALAFLSL